MYDPCRYVTVSGKVPPQAVTSRYVGRNGKSHTGVTDSSDEEAGIGCHAEGRPSGRIAAGVVDDRFSGRRSRISVRMMLAAAVCANISVFLRDPEKR